MLEKTRHFWIGVIFLLVASVIIIPFDQKAFSQSLEEDDNWDGAADFSSYSSRFHTQYLTVEYFKDIKPPANAKELQELARKTYALDFPECDDLSCLGNSGPCEDSDKCYMKMFKVFVAVARVRDRKIVPELIKIALNKDYPVSPKIAAEKVETKEWYQQNMCILRYSAIYALGEIKDPRAIKPLLKLMDEPYTKQKGCMFVYCDSDLNWLCNESRLALMKFKPKGISPELVKHIENQSQWTNKKEGDFMIADCNMHALAQIGDEGRKLILEKLKSKNLNDDQLDLYLRGITQFPADDEILSVISDELKNPRVEKKKKLLYLRTLVEFPLSQKTAELLKSFISSQDKEFAESAVDLIVEYPKAEKKELYLWLLDRGYAKQACSAFGRIRTPDLVPVLAGIIEKENDDSKVNAAINALNNFEPEQITPALPALISKIQKKGHVSPIFYYAIAKCQDPSVIKDLREHLYADKTRPENIIVVEAIGMISGPESEAALREIIEEKDFRIIGLDPDTPEFNTMLAKYEAVRLKALYWLMVKNGEKEINYGLRYFDKRAVDKEWDRAKFQREKAAKNLKK